MIIAQYGKPRSGKSYETVAFQIIPALKSGRKVITNIPLNIEKFNLLFGHEFISEHLEIRTESKGLIRKKINGQYQNVIGKPFESLECYSDDWRNDDGVGALLIIDECHYVLPRGKTPIEISQWFSMHGHAGFDIILLTQNFRKVDLDIRDMCELVFYVHKMTTFGESDKYIRKVKNGFDGAFDLDNQDIREYDKKWFPFYKSHTQSPMAIKEEGAKDVKGHKRFYQKFGFLFVGLIFFGSLSWLISLLFSDDAKAIEQDKKPVAEKIKLIEDNKKLEALKPKSLNKKLETDVEEVKESSLIEPSSAMSVRLIANHPYYKVKLVIKGSLKLDNAIHYVFDATNNGNHDFVVLSDDLLSAGYTLKAHNTCLVELSYQDKFKDYIICDSANLTGNFASNTSAHSNSLSAE